MTIKYGGAEYELNFVDEIRDNKGDEKLGFFEPAKGRITISKNQNKYSSDQTIWHELVHMVCMHAGLELKENQIEAIAFGVTEIQRLNPDLWGEDMYANKN